MGKIALYVGSFDPFTVGHKNIVDRALSIFDGVIIGIGDNSNKERYVSKGKMFDKIYNLYEDKPVKIVTYSGLTSELAKKFNVDCLVRGIRNTTDFEYEKNLAVVNKELCGVDTIFIPTDKEFEHVSSSMVRELLKYNQDVSKYVPYNVNDLFYHTENV